MATSRPGTFELVAVELGRALEPLAGKLDSPHHALTFLAELGLRLPHGALSPGLTTALETAHAAAQELPTLTHDLLTAIDDGDALDIVAKAVPVAAQVAVLLDALDTIASHLSGLGAVPGINPADLNAFAAALPKRLFETLLVEYFQGFHKIPLSVLEFVGVVERVRQNVGSTDPGNPEFEQKQLRFDRIGALLSSPDQIVTDLYGWGQPALDVDLLLRRVADVLRALRVPVTLAELPGPPPRPAIEVCVLSIAPTTGLVPPGLEALLTSGVADGLSFDLPFTDGWVAHFSADGALSAAVGIRVQPPADVSVVPPSGSVQGRLKAGIARVPVAPEPDIVLLGLAGGTSLTAERIGFNLVAGFRWDSASGQALGDFGFEGEIRGGKLKISMGGADGFLADIMSTIQPEANFSLGFGWTAGQGLYFVGSSTLEIQLPVHISFGPVELDALTLQVGIEGQTFPIALTMNIKAALGPLQAVVEQIGARVELSFPAGGRGDIGPLDVGFGFQAPKGVGLSLDVGVVKGGGYLFLDPDRGEYAGALELTFAEFVSLKAIGIITTRMPDGSEGFSLLIIITAEFGSGIQLGFGFTLLSVGGLIGLNRAMQLQPLMEGIRTGAVNSVMFPQDVVANAPKIISDLRTFFPPRQGTFLIGPMAKLGWGTPTLISLSVGVIFEIPGNIAIVGVLRVALPADEAAVVVLQVNFAGAIEFDKQRIFFFAAMFESRILFATIQGEMGLLVAYGSDANFVASVGGFHPRFTAPPLPFPSPRRVSIELVNTPVARVRVEGYLAVTSNTAQFGARVELFFGLSVLNVSGHVGFDALFQFSPFAFVVSISASLSVKVFGIGLFSVSVKGSLEGPTPWRARGKGRIKILFVKISVDIDVTWGERRDTTLPPISVMPLLLDELAKPSNWQAELPAGTQLLVSTRKLSAEEGALVLHPVGVLRISQRFVPLDLPLDKVGNQQPNDVDRLTVDAVGGGLARQGDTTELFAPAQFQKMDDADKLSRPAFAPQKSGVVLSASGAQLRSSRMVKRRVRYEEIIVDSNFKRFARRLTDLTAKLFEVFWIGSAVAKSELSMVTWKATHPFDDLVSAGPDTFTVAHQATNEAVATDAVAFTSEASAQAYLAGLVAADPALGESLHVIPEFERVG